MAMPKNVLLVEDDEFDADCALNLLQALDIEVTHCRTAQNAVNVLRASSCNTMGCPHIDGVILDVFIPLDERPQVNHPDDPCGLLVASAAEESQIPFVICAGGNHDCIRYEWIRHLVIIKSWHFIDSLNHGLNAGERPYKNWGAALRDLHLQLNQ